MIWHNRLFLVSEIFRRYRRDRNIYALISASRDGAWLADFFELIGIKAVRGSSSRFGREAASALIEEIRAGHDIGITPDGPRGPRYDFKAGGLIVARRAQAPILLVGAIFESAWQLGSWDGFYLPKPFSKILLTADLILSQEVPKDDSAVEALRRRMLRLNPDRVEINKGVVL